MSFSVYIKPHSNAAESSEPHHHRQACHQVTLSIMPKKLQNYISKLRRNPNPQINFSSSKNWIFSACKHPKTLSLDVDHQRSEDQAHQHYNNNNDSASLSDVDRFLFENFKSLYVREEGEETERNAESVQEIEAHTKLEPILFESPRLDLGLPPDLRGSNRFFVTPGLSGSLVEDAARLSATTTCDDEEAGSSSSSTTTINDDPNLSYNHRESQAMETLPQDFIAVLMYSPRPYDDFRRSMQDIVEARLKNHDSVDWDFMEELLFYYLNLNEKKSHKFILSAFVDVIGGLRRRSETLPATLPRSVRTVRIDRLSRRW